MFTHSSDGAAPREVAFGPNDAIYQLYRQTKNPYLERAIAPATKKLERSSEDLHRLFRLIQAHHQYEISPVNTRLPHLKRDLSHPAPPKSIHPQYLAPERMSGDIMRLPWMIEVFFESVLSRLEKNPGHFKDVVEELMQQFQQDRVRIKIYDAYRTFADWDDLMRTLREITKYPAPETFDLFCSALFAYYDLAFPPTDPAPPPEDPASPPKEEADLPVNSGPPGPSQGLK